MKRALAAVGFAAAILLGAVLFLSAAADPAAADNHEEDHENDPVEKLWDTDNLLYTANTGSVSARTFGVPFHNYGGYLRTGWAAPCLRYSGSGSIVYAELAASVYGGGCPSGFSAMTVWCLHDPHDPGDPSYYGPPVRIGGRAYCYHINGSSTIYNTPAGVKLCGVLMNGRWNSLEPIPPRSSCSNPSVRVYNSSRTHQACKAAVADAFFQTVSGGRNEFPVLEITDTESVENSPALKDWGTSRNTGCDEFALAQDRLLTTTAANGGYWLDDRGRLQQSSMPAHTASARSVTQQRVAWVTRSGFAYTLHIEHGLTVPQAYAARVDAGSDLAISPAGTTLTVPSPAPSWPATKTASGVEACQSNVADGFFQTDNAVVNDFPSLSPTGTGGDLRWVLAAGSAGNDAGCDVFVSQQDRLAAQAAAGTGFALDSDGKLTVFNPGADVRAALTAGRSSSELGYGNWRSKGSGYTVVDLRGATTDTGYLRRVDGQRNAPRAIHPAAEQWTVPDGTSGGNFGASWHGQGGKVSDRPNYRRHLSAAKADALCLNEFHPRGEDSVDRIGESTGRTLSSLTQILAEVADRYWCRSDLRYERSFKAEHHTGVTEAQRHPQARGMAAGTVFTAFGRLGCYYTATGRTSVAGGSAQRCGYMFPLPQCDPDPDNGDSTLREYTAAEIGDLGIAAGSDFNRAEGARCAAASMKP